MIRPPNPLSHALVIALALAGAGCRNEPTPAPAGIETPPVVATQQAPPANTAATESADPAVTMPVQQGVDAATASSAPVAPPAPNPGNGWQYDEQASARGPVPRASIRSDSGNETLVFQHDPVAGRNAHLLLPAEVDCPTSGCRIRISLDGGAPGEMWVSRPESADVRLNLRDPRKLWNDLRGISRLDIQYPGGSGPVTASFAVAGTDLSKLPRWETK